MYPIEVQYVCCYIFPVAYPGVGLSGPRPDQPEIMTKILASNCYLKSKSKSKISLKILPLLFK